MTANTIHLRLAGPMQSWGQQDSADFRGTGEMPTKSGIVGLLACARGIRSDAGILEIANAIQIGIRVDKPGNITSDLQTDGSQHWSAEGKARPVGYRLKMQKEYLVDASFFVAARCEDEELLELITHALQHPTWPYYLGRKSCPPSAPVYAGVGEYPDIEAALLAEWPDELSQATVRIESPDGGNLIIQDRPVIPSLRTFAPNSYREFVLRRPQ
jgi:CRISPR system Cascade subunit CasD